MRTRTNLLLAALVATACWFSAVAAYAEPLTVDTQTLSKANPELDGTEVRFVGEAIGETLRADGRSRWVNVLADGVAIGVVAPTDTLDVIDGFGVYSRRGTIVEVTGVFNVACPQHGGDLDVHASEIRALEPSEPIERPANLFKGVVAAALFVVAGALAYLFRLRKRHTL